LHTAWFPGDPALSDPPPKEQWAEILTDIRTEQQRKLVRDRGHSHVWLRACYTDDSQETYGELLEEFDAEQALESEDLVLDDPQLYSYSDNWTSSRLPSDGDDWTTIFSVLPEIFFSPGNDTISDYWMNGSKSLMNHLAYEMSLLDYQKSASPSNPRPEKQSKQHSTTRHPSPMPSGISSSARFTAGLS
jgi:hypothetical protein